MKKSYNYYEFWKKKYVDLEIHVLLYEVYISRLVRQLKYIFSKDFIFPTYY